MNTDHKQGAHPEYVPGCAMCTRRARRQERSTQRWLARPQTIVTTIHVAAINSKVAELEEDWYARV